MRIAIVIIYRHVFHVLLCVCINGKWIVLYVEYAERTCTVYAYVTVQYVSLIFRVCSRNGRHHLMITCHL